MPKKPDFLTIIDEIVAEETAVINEVMEEEILPIMKYRKKLEQEAFGKAYEELREAERGEV